MAGRDGSSRYFEVAGSGKKPYEVTINFDTGHWCSCRGMISKKSTYQEDAGRTAGTSCKHIKKIINEQFGGDWGTKRPDGSRVPALPVSPATAPPKPEGRRAAILAKRARLDSERMAVLRDAGAEVPLQDRIAALEAAREGVS